MSTRKEDIIELISGPWESNTFKGVAQEMAHNNIDIEILFELNEHTAHRIAWRSAYLLDLAHDSDNSVLDNYLPRIIERTPKLTNQSIKRHYLRILSQHDLSELADGTLLDCCLEWLQTDETPIASKAHCMTIVHKLTLHYPELITEFKAVLENLLPYGSKGEVSRAKIILKELNKR